MKLSSLLTYVVVAIGSCFAFSVSGFAEGTGNANALTAPRGSAPPEPFMVTGKNAMAPMGWTDFCRRYPEECQSGIIEPERVGFDADTRELILRVNASVNAAIRPLTDRQQWGTEERWDFAETGFGDCEEYALLKRSWLASGGLPKQALRITVATDMAGDGHALLTILTDQGDYILDNMTDDVKLWGETPYVFIKRLADAGSEWQAIGAVENHLVAAR